MLYLLCFILEVKSLLSDLVSLGQNINLRNSLSWNWGSIFFYCFKFSVIQVIDLANLSLLFGLAGGGGKDLPDFDSFFLLERQFG